MRLRNVPQAKEIIEKSPYVLKNPQQNRGKWSAFTGGRELRIEIGTGKGQFLTQMARLFPDCFFVGVERYESVLFRACEKLEKMNAPAAHAADGPGTEDTAMAGNVQAAADAQTGGDHRAAAQEAGNAQDASDELPAAAPDNLIFLCMDARQLPEVFAPGEAEVIYLNFSDPWPKARHDKRRLTHRGFLAMYTQFLKPGGVLEFKTDNAALFAFTEEEFAASPAWRVTGVTHDLHRDPVMGAGNVMTEYERKFSLLGNKICKLTAVYEPMDAQEDGTEDDPVNAGM